VQFALRVSRFELVEAVEFYGAAEFGWSLYGERGFFSEDYVLADVYDGVERYGPFGAECSRHLLLYLQGRVVNENAGFRLAFGHFR